MQLCANRGLAFPTFVIAPAIVWERGLGKSRLVRPAFHDERVGPAGPHSPLPWALADLVSPEMRLRNVENVVVVESHESHPPVNILRPNDYLGGSLCMSLLARECPCGGNHRRPPRIGLDFFVTLFFEQLPS
jgi:hypothetical protein